MSEHILVLSDIQLKRGVASALRERDIMLKAGEVCLETDTQKFKVGDGETSWNDLPYWGGGNSETSLSYVYGTVNDTTDIRDRAQYIVGSDPTGAFANGSPDDIAVYNAADDVWTFTPPTEGQGVYDASSTAVLVYRDGSWLTDFKPMTPMEQISYEDDKLGVIWPTNERVNGKRLYRVVVKSTAVTANSTTYNIPHGLTDFDYVDVDYSRSYFDRTTSTVDPGFMPIPTVHNNNAAYQTYAQSIDDGITILTGASWTAYAIIATYVCFKFTKASEEAIDGEVWAGSDKEVATKGEPGEPGRDGVELQPNDPRLMGLGHLAEIRAFMRATPPAGWLVCNGAAYLREDYPHLYNELAASVPDLIVDADSFAVPDLRGEFLRGLDDGRGLDPDVRTLGSVQDDALQNITGDSYNMVGLYVAQNDAADPVYSGALGTSVCTARQFNPVSINGFNAGLVHFDASQSPGARTSTETRPHNVAVLHCICYEDITVVNAGG